MRCPVISRIAVRTVCYEAVGLLIGVGVYPSVSYGQRADEAPREYTNHNYAYAVTLPTGVSYETGKPPNPDHGFLAKLSPGTSLWVDASSSDALTLSAAVRFERQLWTDRCRLIRQSATTLGSLPAVRLLFRCRSSTARDPEQLLESVLTKRTGSNFGNIVYSVRLEGPHDATWESNLRTFQSVVDGLRLTSPP